MKVKCPCCHEEILIALWSTKTKPRAEVLVGTLEQIADVVSFITGISVSELKTPVRQRRVVHARMQAMWLMRHYTDQTFLAIGRFFNRDHTSVIHGINTINALMDVYPHEKEAIETLKTACETLAYKKAS